MAQSSVISKDTMLTSSSSSGTHSVSPFTMTGNRERNQMVSDYRISSYYHSWHSSSSLLLSPSSPADDADDDRTSDIDVKKSELTSSHDSRTRPVVPATIPNSPTQTDAAISASTHNTYNNKSQDVLPVVNHSASYSNSSTAPRRNVFASPLETFPQHDYLNQPSNRPRTSNQVFSSTQDLAAHYGIPQILPPAPRTTPQRTRPQPQHSQDFLSLSSNYLNMLSQKPTDNTMAADSTSVVTTVSPADLLAPAQTSDPVVDFQGIIDVLTGEYRIPSRDSDVLTHSNFGSSDLASSPEFRTSPEFLTSPFMTSPYDDFNDTSPYDDSPYSDLLMTPVVSDMNDVEMHGDMLTSPLVGYNDDLQLFGDMPLFPTSKPSNPVLDTPDVMYTMSPGTPLLDFVDPASVYPSPRLPSDKSLFPTTPSTTRRKSSATGTRKNITPESLVPLDAPTQPRKYKTPSVTSRKDFPSVFAKKRSRSQALGDEEDELAEEPLAPNATEKEQIEWKRRQNTLAARKSRKRKLLHQQQLEDAVVQLTKEKDVWKTRALTMQQMLHSHGVPSPEFTD